MKIEKIFEDKKYLLDSIQNFTWSTTVNVTRHKDFPGFAKCPYCVLLLHEKRSVICQL